MGRNRQINEAERGHAVAIGGNEGIVGADRDRRGKKWQKEATAGRNRAERDDRGEKRAKGEKKTEV